VKAVLKRSSVDVPFENVGRGRVRSYVRHWIFEQSQVILFKTLSGGTFFSASGEIAGHLDVSRHLQFDWFRCSSAAKKTADHKQIFDSNKSLFE
jgi:hypothetical protein